MSLPTAQLEAAHKHCANHRSEIEASATCGCFYCLETYPPSQIDEWLEEGTGTAHCPRCFIDSVIGDASGFPAGDPTFLRAMHAYWFERSVSVPEAGIRIWAGQTTRWIDRLLGIGANKKKLNA